MKKQLFLFSAVFFVQFAFSQSLEEKPRITAETLPYSAPALAAPDGTLRIEGAATVTVSAGTELKVTDLLNNLGTESQLVVESDGNLIQVNDAAVNTGNMTSKRDINIGTERSQYNYLGTPVAFKSGETFKTIYSGITYTLYYNQANNYFYSSSGVNIPGRGLAVKEPTLMGVPAAPKTTASFKGIPQNGEILLPVSNSDTSGSVFGFNLVGNPYPSNIDLRKLYDINGGKTDAPQSSSPNISATFYFWDNNNNTQFQQQGSGYSGQAYALFNVLAGPAGTGLGTKSTSGSKIPTKTVKVGQGFMTKSLVSTYNFRFNNSIRTGTVPANDFLGNKSYIAVDRYRLHLNAPSGISSVMAVVYYAGGNNLFGLEDSRSMGGSDALYSIVENEKLAINTRSTFQLSDKIPVGIQNFVRGSYEIGLEKAEGIFETGQKIYLKDSQTGTVTCLTEGNYTFEADAGETDGRFELLYAPETVLATDAAVKETVEVYRDSNEWVVRSKTKNITGLEIYDASGRLVYEESVHAGQVSVPKDRLTEGMYILKVKLGDEIYIKKIIR